MSAAGCALSPAELLPCFSTLKSLLVWVLAKQAGPWKKQEAVPETYGKPLKVLPYFSIFYHAAALHNLKSNQIMLMTLIVRG